mmetsp:Transcript_92576/g.283495  ORF Transcript_92576/g.283495 Transcript_92576/m.283495 type:complete len:240 (+) Transcript_92576:371-1090(+)
MPLGVLAVGCFDTLRCGRRRTGTAAAEGVAAECHRRAAAAGRAIPRRRARRRLWRAVAVLCVLAVLHGGVDLRCGHCRGAIVVRCVLLAFLGRWVHYAGGRPQRDIPEPFLGHRHSGIRLVPIFPGLDDVPGARHGGRPCGAAVAGVLRWQMCHRLRRWAAGAQLWRFTALVRGEVAPAANQAVPSQGRGRRQVRRRGAARAGARQGGRAFWRLLGRPLRPSRAVTAAGRAATHCRCGV